MGVREDWGQERPFDLTPHDRRHHLYAIGKSGTGKTTLLRNMILQDIVAGNGVGVIDPHGDLATELLDYIPRSRIEDVVYFNPADMEFPIGFNLLGQTPPDARHLVASGIVNVFKSRWSASWGPRMEYVLYATVAALLDCENVSLLGIQRMLSDGRYRAWVVRQVKDPLVRSFWVDEFEGLNKSLQQEMVAPIQNKVGQLLMSPHLRNILGQIRSRIDARFMMDKGRIFIADVSKGKLGADKANLLGALLVTEDNPRYRFPGKREKDGVVIEFRKTQFLYNGHRITEPVDDLIVVEGFAGVWWLTQHGFASVVGTMGSDCSERQSELIVSSVKPAGRVWIVPDRDKAGERYAQTLLGAISPHRFVRWVKLADGKQPTDLAAAELKNSFTF